MKLKVKHIQLPQGPAQRLEVANDGTCADLVAAIAAGCFELEAGAEVVLSLNKKDPIQGGGEGDDTATLRSLGLCSGDLVWVLSPPLAAAQQPAAPPEPATVSAAATHQAAATAMDVDDVAPDPAAAQQQQSAAHAGDDAAGMTPHADHMQQLQEQLQKAPPKQPWIPHSLARLLLVAAAEVSHVHSQQQQQQQQLGMPLTAAQVLVLTAHAALLECGFVPVPLPAQHSSDQAQAQASSSSSTDTQLLSGCSGLSRAQLLQLLRGAGGIYTFRYQLLGAGSELPQPPPAAAAVAAAVAGGVDDATSVSVELRGVDMGKHLVLLGSLKAPAPAPAAAAPAPAAAPGAAPAAAVPAGAPAAAPARGSSAAVSPQVCRVVATVNLEKAQVSRAAASPDAAGAAAPESGNQQQQQQHQKEAVPVTQQQQQPPAAPCAFADLPRLWVQLKDRVCLPLLMASCAAAGLPAPVGLNNLTYELQEAILGLLKAKDLAAVCCSCTPMRHRASTDTLWRPLFDQEFPPPADPQQQQPQQQQPQQQPLHSRLQFLLSHGQRFTLRQSLIQLRQEAGRRGWQWAFGAAWTQRARLLAEAERSRRMPAMPLHLPPYPHPGLPWGPLRPRHPIMPPNIIGGDYDRLPNLGGLAGGLAAGGGSAGAGGLGFSGGGVNLGAFAAGSAAGGGAGVGLGSGGALFAAGRGVGGGGGGGGGRGGHSLPGFGAGRPNTRLY